MTTYQSQTVYTEDREGNSLAFSTVNQDGEEAVLKAAVDVTLPDGQQVLMNVLYDAEDVAGLIAYLHDNFGGRGAGGVRLPESDRPVAEQAVLNLLKSGHVITGPNGFPVTAFDIPQTPSDLEYATRLDGTTMPAPRVVPGENCWCGGAVGARQPGDHFGLGCLLDITHDWTAASAQSQALIASQNDAGAATPPADAQGASNTPQSGAGTPDQSAAESATAATPAAAAPASTSDEKPKRKRRTKLEIAFDTAMEAHNAAPTEDTWQVLGTARAALQAKDPGNQRLAESLAAVQNPDAQPTAAEAQQVGFAPEQQPITNPFQQSAPLAAGAQPVPGQVYAPDADGGIPAQAFQVPAFQPGQVPELGQTQVSPEEQQAAQGFPCPVHASDGRPCQRPYGHELATAANPQPKPHVYATTDPQALGQPVQPQVTDPLPWNPANQQFAPGGPISSGPMTPTVGSTEHFANGMAAPLSFQVPPTPEATVPHPETNLQPPAPAAPSWAEPV